METMLCRQTIAPLGRGTLRLSAKMLSPYFQLTDTRRIDDFADRDTSLFPTNYMAVTKAIATAVIPYSSDLGVNVQFYDNNTCVDEYNIEITNTATYTSPAAIRTAAEAVILTYASNHSYSAIASAANIIWANANINDILPAVINNVSRSIVTGTGATGFQVSSTRNAFVSYSVTVATTATIGGNSSGTVVLEVAPTNSATSGDWVEIARFTNGQAISLAVVLQSVQTLAGQVNGMVPAGYYVKIRSINNSGTPSYSYNSGREILQ